MFFLSLLLLLSSQCVYAGLPDDGTGPDVVVGVLVPPPLAARAGASRVCDVGATPYQSGRPSCAKGCKGSCTSKECKIAAYTAACLPCAIAVAPNVACEAPLNWLFRCESLDAGDHEMATGLACILSATFCFPSALARLVFCRGAEALKLWRMPPYGVLYDQDGKMCLDPED